MVDGPSESEYHIGWPTHARIAHGREAYADVEV